MKPMETLQDLIDEAKLRTAWWAICTFAVSYFLTHTSKSMWTNIPMAIIILSLLRYIVRNVDFRWKVQPVQRQKTYLSHLPKRQTSINELRLSTYLPASRWRRKVNSPPVEDAILRIISKILQDFVVDLWYSSITSDKEFPERIQNLVLEALAEICGRVKTTNLVELLTRDIVDLIGNHLELFRRNQLQIGADVMKTLSSEERDDRLKNHLLASKEIHPALLSPDAELKFLQQIVGGIMPIVLKPQEGQSSLICCFSRELLSCLVLQPVMNFASPAFINELIVNFLDNKERVGGTDSVKSSDPSNVVRTATPIHKNSDPKALKDPIDSHLQSPKAEWAVALEATTRRRSEVLAPENLDSMWTRGRHYQTKIPSGGEVPHGYVKKPLVENDAVAPGTIGNKLSPTLNASITSLDDRYMVNLMDDSRNSDHSRVDRSILPEASKSSILGDSEKKYDKNSNQETAMNGTESSQRLLKRSSSSPDINMIPLENKNEATGSQERHDNIKLKEDHSYTVNLNNRLLPAPKIRCRVVGAYYEKVSGKPYAVYSIAVTDADNNTWFVKRRYRNFERLHRYLKEIPNYTLHLPPKSYLASSTDDSLVHQRCILLDKYLQDLLAIANVAEQHEVWDFLSVSSLNYSSGKSISTMNTLAVNVDDAMDDIVRQVKGISGGLKRKVVSVSELSPTSSQLVDNRMALSLTEEILKRNELFIIPETSRSLSDNESNHEDHTLLDSGYHSESEVNSRGLPSRSINRAHENSVSEIQITVGKPERSKSDASALSHDSFEDPPGIPPEWMPSNVSVPLLNLVDTVFQLKRRGWLRRQVLWISKQILQLVMEDAIDDWILRQINWLRREDNVAHGIKWIEDVLWPNGTFFTRVESPGHTEENQSSSRPPQNANQSSRRTNGTSSFEYQFEASRRADIVKKLLLGGTPVALVSIIGTNQCRRSARDIYYFLQSSVCIKQLAYAMLELVLVTVFPELRPLIEEIHAKARKGATHL